MLFASIKRLPIQVLISQPTLVGSRTPPICHPWASFILKTLAESPNLWRSCLGPSKVKGFVIGGKGGGSWRRYGVTYIFQNYDTLVSKDRQAAWLQALSILGEERSVRGIQLPHVYIPSPDLKQVKTVELTRHWIRGQRERTIQLDVLIDFSGMMRDGV